MSFIVSWCLRNKSVVFLATFLLIGSGLFASTRLNQELLPDIDFPVILVSTPVPGAGPDVVDEQVSQPIEGLVSGAGGIENIQTTSSRGFSVVEIEFGLDVDTEDAESEVQSALEKVSLPSQAAEPEVIRQSASEFPILNVSLAAENGDLADLTEYTRDEVIPLLDDVEGIGRVELVGGAEDQIRVDLDPEELEQARLPAAAVVGSISGANANAPVGSVEVNGLSTPVRVESEIGSAEALKDLPVGGAGVGGGGATAGGDPKGASGGTPKGSPKGALKAGSGGGPTPEALGGAQGGGSSRPVLLGDVAEVREFEADIAGISRTNGQPSLGLNIAKEADANTVEVAEGIEAALDEVRGDLGEEQVLIVFNSAEDVEESVSGIVQEGIIGALLAVLIIYAFLRSLRATLVTAVSLPTSVLAALLFSWGYDLTLNILTLAGLTIAVGRVVDDAIVVLENSYRYVQAGYDPEEAALKGTTEVASPITSSTLTSIAVFLPLGVVGGVVSKFFVPLSLTVALALLASLIVAVTIIPVLVSVFIKRVGPRKLLQEEESSRGQPPEDWPGDLPVAAWKAPHQESPPGESPELAIRRGSTWEQGLGTTRPDEADQPSDQEPSAEPHPVDTVSRRNEDTGPRPWEPPALGFFIIVVASVVAAGFAGVLRDILGGVSDAFSEIDYGSPALLGLLAGALGILVGLGIAALTIRVPRWTSPRGGEGGEGSLVRLYTPSLRWSLRHRAVVLLLAFLVFAGGLAAIPLLAVNFIPPGEERLLLANVELANGIGLEQASDELRPFEELLEDDPGVESYQISIGGEDNLSPDAPIRTSNQAQMFITVGEEESVSDTFERVGEGGRDLYGEDGFRVQVVQNGPPQGALEVTITGGSEEELEAAAEQIIEEISDIDGLSNLESDITGGTPEVAVRIDPEEAAGAGLSPAQVSATLGTLIGEGNRTTIGETPVAVGVAKDVVDSLEEVEDLPVGIGATVGDVAEVEEVEAPSAVRRADGERAVTVRGRITTQDTNAVSTEAQERIDGLELPNRVTATAGGESEDIQESFYNLFFSIIVALVLVYLILVIFFGSLAVPLVILLAVPLTTAGAFGALLLTNTALSLPALLGILLLIGIVVSNAILLVDFATKARGRYENADDAIVEAGRARLRPILMTALATIFALLPLALGLAGGGSLLISSSLALTVIGGLLTSTFLTLLVVPVGYSLLEDARRRRKKGKSVR